LDYALLKALMAVPQQGVLLEPLTRYQPWNNNNLLLIFTLAGTKVLKGMPEVT